MASAVRCGFSAGTEGKAPTAANLGDLVPNGAPATSRIIRAAAAAMTVLCRQDRGLTKAEKIAPATQSTATLSLGS